MLSYLYYIYKYFEFSGQEALRNTQQYFWNFEHKYWEQIQSIMCYQNNFQHYSGVKLNKTNTKFEHTIARSFSSQKDRWLYRAFSKYKISKYFCSYFHSTGMSCGQFGKSSVHVEKVTDLMTNLFQVYTQKNANQELYQILKTL